jgi:cholesterol transport system auxiliary component
MRAMLSALAAALLLGGCSLAPTVPPKAIYDLGPAPASAPTAGALAWRVAEVSAPPWLGSEGIAYRLAFDQPQRLQHYRDSAWAAPPAALLTQRLREQLAAPPGCAGDAATTLSVHLDAFEQVFSAPDRSQVVLRLHATLGTADGPAQQRRWHVERATATPDAPGAVRALAQAVDDVLPQLADWLAATGCAQMSSR